MTLAQEIKQQSCRLGFDLVGITDAEAIDDGHVRFFTDWLGRSYAGRMDYMRRNLEKRINPSKLLPGAQSVIVVGLNYTPTQENSKKPKSSFAAGRVANFAQYEDYHLFIKKQLRKLVAFIAERAGDGVQFKMCVDAEPAAERAIAAKAGLGFIGKNHMLINPQLGCQILLGEIITSLKLPADKPVKGDCSNCGKCVKACPTGALRSDGQFDSNICISYLTIEYKEQIAPDLAEKIGDRVFGCDECVLACPWQKNAPPCKNKEFKFYADRTGLHLKEILSLSQRDFDERFADSCFARLGLENLKRNAKICLDNLR
jgi:epoxyqueuosine reductase